MTYEHRLYIKATNKKNAYKKKSCNKDLVCSGCNESDLVQERLFTTRGFWNIVKYTFTADAELKRK